MSVGRDLVLTIVAIVLCLIVFLVKHHCSCSFFSIAGGNRQMVCIIAFDEDIGDIEINP